MSKFIIACPVCHNYTQASTGFFASRKVRCACGHTIHVKTDRMTTKVCPSCGNQVVYDQAEGKHAKCPVCHAQLVNDASYINLLHFHCATCGCHLQADKGARQITCPICDTVADVQQEIKKAEARDAAVPARISYEGDNKTFVWKHPMTDFVTGSQLIVHESQEAVFFRNGEALDSLGAGRYTLDTGILPRMESLYKLPVQGMPFHAEVYFVNLTTQMGIRWGTPSKVGLFDPATGMHVELGASGFFSLRVTDARRLLIKLVGTTDGLSQEDLFGQNGMGHFRSIIITQVKAHLAKAIKANHISVLELDEHLDALSLTLREAINAELTEYGMEMPEFLVNSIVTPDDDPNFRRMKQQHAEKYLRVREEEIRKAEAEAAFERMSVEAQTAARMKVIGAQGDADVIRLKAQAEAEAYRMKAEAEAQEMHMKGYTYQQETSRQVGLEAMRTLGSSGAAVSGGVVGDMMQLGVGIGAMGSMVGAMGSVVGMTKDAINPALQQAGADPSAWDCTCGQKGITSNFCPNCGAKKMEKWCCTCGQTDIASRFCPNCGKKKPETWDCACGQKGNQLPFCPNCGKKREE